MSAPRYDAWAFVQYAAGECAASGVKFRLEARKRTRGGLYGYFSSEGRRELFVCVCVEDWPMVLAHELSHLQQLAEGVHQWSIDYIDIFEGWYKGYNKKRLKAAQIKKACREVQKMELDAERRALRFAKHFHLTDDIDLYTQNANLYVWKQEIARRIGRWPDYGEATDTVIGAMPKKLMAQSEIGKPPELMMSLVKA